MKSHLLIIKIFVVVGAVWLYAIRPVRAPEVQKLGPSPIIERAASFKFPQKIESNSEADAVARISGEHRELSLREISSVGAAVKAKELSQDNSSASNENTK